MTKLTTEQAYQIADKIWDSIDVCKHFDEHRGGVDQVWDISDSILREAVEQGLADVDPDDYDCDSRQELASAIEESVYNGLT